MKIALLQTGKTTDKQIEGLMDLYTGRIKKYIGFDIITLPDPRNSGNLTIAEQKIKEGRKIIQSVTPDDFVILLDERGKEFRTVEFSSWLEKVL